MILLDALLPAILEMVCQKLDVLFFSKLLLLSIGVAFILAESKSFQKKLAIIFKEDKSRIHSFQLFSHNIQKYFIIKTFTSFLTGFVITVMLVFFGVDYPVLWGVLAFFLNFTIHK